MGTVRKFLALPGSEQRLLASAFFAVGAARLRLAVMPFRAGKGYARGCRPAGKPGPGPDRIAWAIDVASRRLGNMTCLVRALAGHALLARRGFSSCISLGVASSSERDAANGLIAHAWLESEGRILLGGPNIRGYKRLLQWCN